MARKCKKDNRYLAKLVTSDMAPCAFCLREVDDEVTYGKLYAIGDIQCHYFCCLLSCCLIQKGHDEEGLFGFMYTDIITELERCKKHKCSYCGRNGANLGCCVSACRKQFHLPCGRDKNAVSLYYGSYKTFCQHHAPKQKISEHVMAKATLRKRADRKGIHITAGNNQTNCESESIEEMSCVICYEGVQAYPTINTFWPACCGKDAWFHRTCLQRMALSAGMHYLKCPLCNDKETFYEEVVNQGYYVPDRDAAWELEQNAFAEIYERPATCCADTCRCPMGRQHDADTGKWDIKLCLLCGSAGAHAHCIDQSEPSHALSDEPQKTSNTNPELDQSQATAESIDQSQATVESVNQSSESNMQITGTSEINKDQSQSNESNTVQSRETSVSPEKSKVLSVRFVCKSCQPAAPEDLNELASCIEAIIQQEQARVVSTEQRPIMPSRMSIRRTKGRLPILNRPSTSRSNRQIKNDNGNSASPVLSSREELNLKPPRKPSQAEDNFTRDVENKLLSPLKMLEQRFREKMVCSGIKDAVLDDTTVETLRRKFRKPRPMCEKTKILNNILEGLFDDMKNAKQKEQIKEWNSPKKNYTSIEDFKDIQTEFVESSKTPEKLDKENMYSSINTPSKSAKNTPSKCPRNIKIEDTTSFGVKEENNFLVKENMRNMEENYLNSDKKQLDTISEESVINSLDISDPINIIDVDNDKIIISAKNSDEISIIDADNYKIINSEKKSDEISIIDVDNNKIINSEKNSNVISLIDADNSKIINNEIDKQYNIKETYVNKEVTNVREEFKKLSLKRTISNKDKVKSLKTTKTSSGQNIRFKFMKKHKKTKPSKTNNSIVKKLLTEKDLCSRLLLELTTGKISNENSVNNDLNNENTKMNSETTNNPVEIHDCTEYPSEQNKYSKEKDQTPKHEDNYKTQPTDISKQSSVKKDTVNISKYSMDFDKNSDEISKRSDKPREFKSQSPKSLSHSKFKENNSKYKSLKNYDQSLKENDKTPKKNIETLANSDHTPEALKKSIITIDDSLKSITDTPKRKTIDIKQDSSLEISEHDQSINIDVIKIEDSPTKNDAYKKLKIKLPDQTGFKISPLKNDNELKNEIDFDLESFKKEYLSEVDRKFQCQFKHKHVKNMPSERKFRSPIDFALDAAVQKEDTNSNIVGKKRKMSESGLKLVFDSSVPKKRKTSEGDLKLVYGGDKNLEDTKEENQEVKKKRSHEEKCKRKQLRERRKDKKRKSSTKKNIEVTIDSSEKRSAKNKKLKKKIKTKFAIENENIHVKIKWKKKELSLNIESKQTKRKKKEIKDKQSKFKQCVLQFPEGLSKEVLHMPEKEVLPMKRKYVKQEKSPDKLKQTSIQSFFKLKSEN